MTNTTLIIVLACSIGFGIAGIVIGIFFWLQHKKQSVSFPDKQNQNGPDARSLPTTAIDDKEVQPIIAKEIEEVIPTKLVIANDVNHPLVEIERYCPKQVHLAKLDLPKESISNIAAMLQQAPSLLSNAAIGSGQYYAVTFAGDPEKLLRSSDGAYKAIAVGQNGKFQEIGNVQQWMKRAAVTVAVWQVLAVITAQKFLSDINERLNKIDKGLSEIKQFLENERISRLEGNYDYLRQIAGTIRSGNITPVDCHTIDNQIESIERECSQIIRHIKKDIESSISAINSYAENKKLTTRWTKSRLAKSITLVGSTVDNHTYQTQSLLLALQVKMAALILKGALPVNKQVLEQRIAELAADSSEACGKTQDFTDKVYEVVDKLRGIFTFEDTKQVLINHTENALQFLYDTVEYIDESITTIQERLESSKREIEEPIKLIISLDKHGQVQEVSRPQLNK